MDSDFDHPKSPARPARKKPRKISQASLMNSALYYLGRFSASRAGVRDVLLRRVRRSLFEHGGEREQAEAWVEAVLEDLARQGWLNDLAFAESRARALWAQGTARRTIAQKLSAKGVCSDDIAQALDRLEDEAALLRPVGLEHDDTAPLNPDLSAAVAYARRRRLGPWRPDPHIREERRDKDLAALARRGFSLTIACQVIDAQTPEEAEELR